MKQVTTAPVMYYCYHILNKVEALEVRTVQDLMNVNAALNRGDI